MTFISDTSQQNIVWANRTAPEVLLVVGKSSTRTQTGAQGVCVEYSNRSKI